MNICAIVCEYNPFHKGHLYHLEESRRQLGEETVMVGVMSGDYVQRGEAAVFSKFARAEAACRCGMNLMVELPLPWALSSAEGFAAGAVAILDSLGCTHLSFGSESGELAGLEALAECLLDPMTMAAVKERMAQKPNLSFAAARQQVLEECLGETGRLIETPNNILAVEYLKALRRRGSSMLPITVKRRGSGHDETGEGEILSASQLRQLLRDGETISAYVPPAAMEVFRRELEQGRAVLNRREAELMLLSRLRMLEEKDFLALPDGGDGVGKRLYKAVREEPSLDQILAAAKNKRVALSRLRRMCLAAALGLNAGMTAGEPPYIRVLAADEKGRAFLRRSAGESPIPVVTKPAVIRQLGGRAEALFALGASAHDLYTLSFLAIEDKKGGSDWRTGPKIVKFP